MPSVTVHTLIAADGRALAARTYEPSGPIRAYVALLGAYAVRQRYYRRFATWLAERGVCVLTFDVRGIGESRDGPVRKETVTTSEWAHLDYTPAIAWLRDKPGPRLAVGHSFGAQVLGILDEAKDIDAMYAVAGQLGYWGHFDGFERVKMRALFTVTMPLVTRVFGYLPGWTGIGEDVPGPAMLEWARWLRSPGYLLDHVPGAAGRFRAWPGQFTSLGFTDDTYAPPRGVQALAACFEPSRTDLRVVEPSAFGMKKVDHFGFFRQHEGDVMWADALSWLERWSEASPASATARRGRSARES